MLPAEATTQAPEAAEATTQGPEVAEDHADLVRRGAILSGLPLHPKITRSGRINWYPDRILEPLAAPGITLDARVAFDPETGEDVRAQLVFRLGEKPFATIALPLGLTAADIAAFLAGDSKTLGTPPCGDTLGRAVFYRGVAETLIETDGFGKCELPSTSIAVSNAAADAGLRSLQKQLEEWICVCKAKR